MQNYKQLRNRQKEKRYGYCGKQTMSDIFTVMTTDE